MGMKTKTGKVIAAKPNRRPPTLKMLLRDIITVHNPSAVRHNKIVGYGTQEAREQILYQGFDQLKKLGFHLHDPKNFKPKHMKALGTFWEAQNLKPSTIQSRISVFRTFCEWIGKEGMIGDSADYVLDKNSVKRVYAAKKDKSWSNPEKEIDIEEVLDRIFKVDYRVALYATIAHSFGLRLRECYMLRPHRADNGHYLAVAEGTKGGRDRVVPVETDDQRQVIETAKYFAPKVTDHIGLPGKTLKQTLNRVNYVLRKCGVTERDLGATFHGLRHQYANDLFKIRSGVDSPVRGGPNISGEVDELARLQVSEALGHSRKNITSAYLGGLLRSIQLKSEQEKSE